MKKIGLSVILIAFGFGFLSAQTVEDALRFSNFDYGGTGRFVGVGGSMSALGADLSAVHINPAGLALFRKSEFSFSPGLLINTSESKLLDAGSSMLVEDERTVFNIQNAGFVFTSRPRRSPRWKQVNFGVSINHLGNFNQVFTFEGNSVGSISERWLEFADQGQFNNPEFIVADSASVVYDLEGDGIYETDYFFSNGASIDRRQEVISRGSINELALSLAANYDEVLMIGLKVGLPIINYEFEKEYVEVDPGTGSGSLVPFFNDLSYTEELMTTGSGVHANLGIILRPTQAIRFGASVQSPIVFNLDDEYSTLLFNNYNSEEDDSGDFIQGRGSSISLFEYKLRTPWRYTGGLGFIIGKSGFISGDVEFVDYSSAEYRFEGFQQDEDFLNEEINNQLQDVINIRAGGELALDAFRLRGGIQILPSPYQNLNDTKYNYSAGLGYRGQGFYLDVAWRGGTAREAPLYAPYTTQTVSFPIVARTFRQNNFIFTIGAKF